MIYIDATHYPRVFEHFRHPLNVGFENGYDYRVVKMGDINTGYVLHWYMQYDTNTILDVRYKVYGCAFQIACCSFLSEYLKCKDVSAVPMPLGQLLIETLEIPREKWHCAYVCEDAYRALLDPKD